MTSRRHRDNAGVFSVDENLPNRREIRARLERITTMRELSDAVDIITEAASRGRRWKGATTPEEWIRPFRWKQFNLFMSNWADIHPYPPILYRSHTHGALVPRMIDEEDGEYRDSYASDQRLTREYDAGILKSRPISTPEDKHNPDDLVDLVAKHLRKTQINKGKRRRQMYLSPMVSLSGDFQWAAHNACRKGEDATEGQVAGLAVFDTSKIQQHGILWRVEDLFLFFDGNRTSPSREKIDEYARQWAENADEYLCWDAIPREALLTFVPFERLVQRERAFLRPVFVESPSLGHFKRDVRGQLRPLTVDRYALRVSDFVSRLLKHKHFDIDAMVLVKQTARCFQDPESWGYLVEGDTKAIKKALRRAVAREYLGRVAARRDRAKSSGQYVRKKALVRQLDSRIELLRTVAYPE